MTDKPTSREMGKRAVRMWEELEELCDWVHRNRDHIVNLTMERDTVELLICAREDVRQALFRINFGGA